MNQIENKESVYTTDDELYNKRIKTVVSPDRKKDIDVDKDLYKNIIEAGFSSQLDLNSLNSLNNNAEDRNQMYNIYDSMCIDGTIGAVVETYAEDATEANDSGNIMWVESSKPEVSKYVQFLLDSLNVNKNIYKWAYSLCKYGDLYLHLFRESEYNDDLFKSKKELNEDIKIKSYSRNDNYAHYMEMVKNPAEMFELTRFGKTVGYVKAPVTNNVVKNTNSTFSTFNYKFKKDDVLLYPATEFVHAALEDNISRDEELVNIFLTETDLNSDNTDYTYSVRRGESLLSSVYKVWRELNLLENSVLLNRITKSSIVRLINVEVGDMPKENVTKTLMGVKQMIEQKTAINTGTAMGEYTNPGPVENNVYIPTHEGVGTISTSQIGGDVDVKSLADLDYYMNKMYGQLRVPKQYFAQTDDSTGFNGGSSLTIISSRYAKMIKRIQNTLIQAITDAINLMLLDKGLDTYINEFKLHMVPPTTQEEIDRRENVSSKVQLTSDIMNMLGEIEDQQAKLKILKNLLANIIDDNEIIEIIEEEIQKLENEPEISEEDDADMSMDDENTDSIGGADFDSSSGSLNDFASDEESSMEEPIEDEAAETDNNAEETILPTPDDLGVDMSEPQD